MKTHTNSIVFYFFLIYNPFIPLLNMRSDEEGKMKKILVIIFAFMMVFVFAACGGEGDVATEEGGTPAVNDETTDQAVEDPATDEEGLIGEAEAKRIAADHVGVDVSAMQEYHYTLKTEHGEQAYDISFVANGSEHNVYVNATTGEVMSYESEVID